MRKYSVFANLEQIKVAQQLMLKQLLVVIICCLLLTSGVTAQKAETFDIINYTAPAGWQKQSNANAVIFATEDKTKNIFCAITLFKAVPAGNDAKRNFETVWETFVKQSLNVAAAPEMQAARTDENGWTAQSGFAPYESDGAKGLAMLITLTGNGKVVPVLILTNSELYQEQASRFLASLVLPKAAAQQNSNVQKLSVARKSSFKFTTTNFDDGWTSVEQDDWVQVSKGNTAVLLHYPNKEADAYNSVLRDGLQNAWNILVAPRYSNIRNFELKPIQSFESISFAKADATEKSSGRNVHIVLFKKHFYNGSGQYLEFVTGSKADFEREFGAYRNEEFGWDKLVNMQKYNRFAVAAGDLAGEWTSTDFASLSYYYVSSGGFAGATATSIANSFVFANAGNYQSDHAGASGVVGNQKFSRTVYKGKYTTDNRKITLTNRFNGATEIYDCSFTAVKNGRILRMNDNRGSDYTLVKK